MNTLGGRCWKAKDFGWEVAYRTERFETLVCSHLAWWRRPCREAWVFTQWSQALRLFVAVEATRSMSLLEIRHTARNSSRTRWLGQRFLCSSWFGSRSFDAHYLKGCCQSCVQATPLWLRERLPVGWNYRVSCHGEAPVLRACWTEARCDEPKGGS